jgi:hypothetical protein
MNPILAPISLREITANTVRAITKLSVREDQTCAKGLFEKLELSYVPEPGCPEPFYRRLGFSATGRIDDGEIVMAMPLGAAEV